MAGTCAVCKGTVPEGQRFCGQCGARTEGEYAATQTSVADTRRDSLRTPNSMDDSRFLPGAMVQGRYRIVGLTGRGGMGEVYRADDLKLGQPVALKFLPESLAAQPDRRQRFLDEVRVALRVTHPNVCRVYDIGDEEGHPYLSMEYVDGEDLASLLRRIGRLPQDKAIEIARQLCAGIAAAHEQGILHRDLKPANVMLDGRGRVRITDFGLAGLEESFVECEVRAGTPAYMSPEQLEGKAVTVRSDIYALGLVLYELFTGKQAFGGKSVAEITRHHRESAPTTPTSHVSDLNPAVESVILRCLEKDPSKRPPSALAVSAALPGGDPLAAALAAGETPSPEIVAAAGKSEAMPAVRAFLLAASGVALVILTGWLAGRNELRAYVPLSKRPATLEDRAREMVRELGYTESWHMEPTDWASGYSASGGPLKWLEENAGEDHRWELLRNPRLGAVRFWYRQRPWSYFPNPRWGSISLPAVSEFNPANFSPHEIRLQLDLEGNLRRLNAVPPIYTETPFAETKPDWSMLFRLAGLNELDFEPVPPALQSHVATDQRAAWTGKMPSVPGLDVRIEAGMFRGRPALFTILEPWVVDQIRSDPVPARVFNPFSNLGLLIVLIMGVGSASLARRNLRRGSADRRGAVRVTTAVFFLVILWELLRTHASLYMNPVLAVFVIASGLFFCCLFAAIYLALEPFARRLWPKVMISWSRLVGGDHARWCDPAVGRSVLFGLVAGGLISLLTVPQYGVTAMLAGDPVRPAIGDWSTIASQRVALAPIAAAVQSGLGDAALFTAFLVFFLFVLRRQLAAIAMTFVVMVASMGAQAVSSVPTWETIALMAVAVVIMVHTLLRYGFLALVAGLTVTKLASLATTADWSAWHAQPAIVAVVATAALAAYGYWAATTGRRLIPDAEG